MATIYRVISEVDLGLEDEAFPSEAAAIAYMNHDDIVEQFLQDMEYATVLDAIKGGQIMLSEMNLHT